MMTRDISWLQRLHIESALYIAGVITLFMINSIYPTWLLTHGVLLLALMPVLIDAVHHLREFKFGNEYFYIGAAIIALIGHQEQAITVVLIVLMIASSIGLFLNSSRETCLNISSASSLTASAERTRLNRFTVNSTEGFTSILI